MKVALYARARLSPIRHYEEGVLVEGQINQLKHWAEQEGHEIYKIYSDVGFSSLDESRPGYREMMSDALSDSHPFDGIVVVGLSRLFRDTLKLATYERRLADAKVRLLTITQQNRGDETDELIRQILSICEEFQNLENGKHVRRAMIENARQGYFNGSKPPYGYMAVKTDLKGSGGGFKHKLVPNSEEAKTVQLIFKLAIEGDSGRPWRFKEISTELNNRGIAYRGRKWRPQMVWKILDSSTYYGEYVFNRFDSRTSITRDKTAWVITNIPPIVSKEDFDKAEASRRP